MNDTPQSTDGSEPRREPTAEAAFPASGPPRFLIPVLAAAGVSLAMAAVVTLVLLNSTPPATNASNVYESGQVNTGGMTMPDFALVDQNGRPVTQEILEGRYTLVDFFFTNCPLACPGMTAAMSRVQGETPDGLRLLSINIDGDRDGPEAIRAWGERYNADFTRWTFATGPRNEVWPLLEQGLGLGIEDDPTSPIELDDGGEMAFIQHPTSLFLIGPDRRVLGLYSYQSERQLRSLIERIGDLVPAG